MFQLADRFGVWNVDALEREMPVHLALEWAAYISGETRARTEQGGWIDDPETFRRVMAERYGPKDSDTIG